jgi:MYXO-CTERM domain-containing protein
MKTHASHGFIAFLTALAAMLWPLPAGSIVLLFDPVDQIVPLGTQALVTVEISGTVADAPPSIGSYDLDVAYDGSILAGAGITFETFLGAPLSLTAADFSVPGLFNLAETSFLSPGELDDLQPDTFALAVLAFDTLSVGTSPLAFSRILVGDAFADALDVSGTTGSITVISEPMPLVLAATALAALAVHRRRHASPAVLKWQRRPAARCRETGCGGPRRPSPS